MVEVVFSHSAEGALKYAQNWGEGEYQPPAVSFAFEDGHQPCRLRLWLMKRRYHRKQRQKWESAVVLPGSSRDVLVLALGLSMGDIGPERFWEKRCAVAQAAQMDLLPEQQAQAAEEAEQQIKKARENLQQICTRAKAGEPLRIWAGRSPEDRCMLAWFAAQLEEQGLTPKKLYLVQLPETYPQPGGAAVSCRDWGEVDTASWGRLARDFCREVSADFLKEQAALWHQLQQENTGLRIVEEETVKSVSPDHYDGLIREAIRSQPREFHEAQLIGGLIGQGLPMPDSWIAGRIEKMIAAGQLAILWEETPGSRSYRRRLRQTGAE